MKIVALYSAGTTVSWQTARRRNTFHPRSPLSAIHPCVHPRSHFTTHGTRNENENESTNQRDEYARGRMVNWKSVSSCLVFIHIRVLYRFDITYVHNFARKHASYGRNDFFSLSLSPRYPRGTIETFSGLDFRPCTSSSFFRRESSVKCD